MQDELLYTFDPKVDLFRGKLSDKTKIGAALKNAFPQDQHLWLLVDSKFHTALMPAIINRSTFLDFLLNRLSDKIVFSQWSLYRLSDNVLQLKSAENFCSFINVHHQVLDVVAKQKPLTPVEVSLSEPGSASWNRAFDLAALRLKEADYKSICEEFIERYRNTFTGPAKSNEQAIEMKLSRIAIMGQYVKLSLGD